jgi:hypothetical protein
VRKGQKIAEMGNNDADRVKLRFEIAIRASRWIGEDHPPERGRAARSAPQCCGGHCGRHLAAKLDHRHGVVAAQL